MLWLLALMAVLAVLIWWDERRRAAGLLARSCDTLFDGSPQVIYEPSLFKKSIPAKTLVAEGQRRGYRLHALSEGTYSQHLVFDKLETE